LRSRSSDSCWSLDDRGLVTVGDTVTGRQRVHFCEVSPEGQVYAIRHSL